jgi:hypothetical protein
MTAAAYWMAKVRSRRWGAHWGVLMLSFALALPACTESTGGDDDDDDDNQTTGGNDTGETTGDTTDTGDTSDTGDTTGETTGTGDDDDDFEPGRPADVEVTRIGARQYGSSLGLSKISNALYIGTNGVPDPLTGGMHTGLLALDLGTGQVTTIRDELPTTDYARFSYSEGEHPVPTAKVAVDGERKIILSPVGLVEQKADGTYKLHPLDDEEGVPLFPTDFELDRPKGGAGTRAPALWVAAADGLYKLNPDTFAVVKRWDLAALEIDGGTMLALDPNTGAIYFGAQDATTHGGAIVRVEGETVRRVVGGVDHMPRGRIQDLAWSEKSQGVYVAVAAWNTEDGGIAFWNGQQAAFTIISEARLGFAVNNNFTAFGPSRLHLEDNANLLIVGGQLASGNGGVRGGGIVWIDLVTNRAFGIDGRRQGLMGAHVLALEYDAASKRTFASLKFQCSESKLGDAGLFAFAFDSEGGLHIERPLVSGVRALADDGRQLWVGLRDDGQGISCDGIVVQQGYGRLLSNGAVELAPVESRGEIDVPPVLGVTQLAFDEFGRMIMGTWRDGTVVGAPGAGWAFNQALQGASLYTQTVAWQNENTIWVGGRATHDSSFPVEVDDRSPRGALRVTLNGDGSTGDIERYVLSNEKPETGLHTGLPSSDVRKILVDDEENVWVVCGREREYISGYDHDLGQPFTVDGEERPGGIAKISPDGQTVTTIVGGLDLEDPRDATFLSDGSIAVLDQNQGVVRVTREGRLENLDPDVVRLLPGAAPVGRPEALSLWAGANGEYVAGFAAGFAGRIGGAGGGWVADGNVGFAWTAMQRKPGLWYVGTDEGLVRVKKKSAAAFDEQAPVEGRLPPFATLPDPDDETTGGTDGETTDTGASDTGDTTNTGGTGTDGTETGDTGPTCGEVSSVCETSADCCSNKCETGWAGKRCA